MMRSARLRLGLSLQFEFGSRPLFAFTPWRHAGQSGRLGDATMSPDVPHILLYSVVPRKYRAVMHFGARHTFSTLHPHPSACTKYYDRENIESSALTVAIRRDWKKRSVRTRPALCSSNPWPFDGEASVITGAAVPGKGTRAFLRTRTSTRGKRGGWP